MSDFKKFGPTLRDLIIEAGYCTKLGTPHWARFTESLPDVHYETLRKAVAGERRVTPEIMEACAKAFVG